MSESPQVERSPTVEAIEAVEAIDEEFGDLDTLVASDAAVAALRDSLREDQVDQFAAMDFRVTRPGTPSRRLRLTGNRYTFGSADGCSIRLSDPDLRPMHAVLVREKSRIMVRAYSVPIEVNETRITEAELRVGDVLRLGGYNFELLDSELASSRQSESPSEALPYGRRVFGKSAGSSPSFYGRDRLAGGSPLSSSEDVLWRERLRREAEQWRERQVDCESRETRCDQREAKLRDRESELWTRAEHLYRRESRLQSQEVSSLQLYDELAKRQQELLETRDAARRQQQNFHQREVAFRNQELEYRQRLDDATRQLQQSQQQAESATESVQRIREQYDALSHQVEALSDQHAQFSDQEHDQQADQQRLLAELRRSRDEAIEARAESDAERREAESRLQHLQSLLDSLEEDRGLELAEQHAKLAQSNQASVELREQVQHLQSLLDSLEDDRGSDLAEQHAKLVQSERTSDELRKQVRQLQQSLTDAAQASAALRVDYDGALASVSRLETMIAQNSQQGDSDRDLWETETEELRAAIEGLSTDLDQANRELAALSEANAQLSSRLDDMQRQRDEAWADVETRPTPEAFQAIQEELVVAGDQLSQYQAAYEEAMQRLTEAQREVQHAETLAAQRLAEELRQTQTQTAEPNSYADYAENDEFDSVDDSSDAEATDWDQEHREEAYATRWSNDPDGFRVEDIDESQEPQADYSGESTFDDTADAEADQLLEVPGDLSPDIDQEISAEPESEEEDSIEAYMNRLLRRVQGHPLDEPPIQRAVTPSKQPTNPPPAAKKAVVNPVPSELVKVPVEKIDPDAPLVPRSQAPERTTSLAAMRELANTSARIAISHNAREQTRDMQLKAIVSFACASGAVICGIACFFFIPGILRYLAIAMTVIVAAIYVREGWILFQTASRYLQVVALGDQKEAVEGDAGQAT